MNIKLSKLVGIFIVFALNSCAFVFPPEPMVYYDELYIENATSQTVVLHIPFFCEDCTESNRWKNNYWIDTIKAEPLYRYYNIPQIMEGKNSFQRFVVGDTVKIFSLSGELLKKWYAPFREDNIENHDFFNVNSWKEEVKNLKSGYDDVTQYYYYFTIFNSDLQ
jgi:hypothetical protein